jgi:hypothetical protein
MRETISAFSSETLLNRFSTNGLTRYCRPCQDDEEITFEIASALERVEEFTFAESAVESITLPPSAVILYCSAFAQLERLEAGFFFLELRSPRSSFTLPQAPSPIYTFLGLGTPRRCHAMPRLAKEDLSEEK